MATPSAPEDYKELRKLTAKGFLARLLIRTSSQCGLLTTPGQGPLRYEVIRACAHEHYHNYSGVGLSLIKVRDAQRGDVSCEKRTCPPPPRDQRQTPLAVWR